MVIPILQMRKPGTQVREESPINHDHSQNFIHVHCIHQYSLHSIYADIFSYSHMSDPCRGYDRILSPFWYFGGKEEMLDTGNWYTWDNRTRPDGSLHCPGRICHVHSCLWSWREEPTLLSKAWGRAASAQFEPRKLLTTTLEIVIVRKGHGEYFPDFPTTRSSP